MYREIIFKLIGGLGIFLLGMKYMSEGMHKIAGEKLKHILNTFTSTKIRALLAGLGVTSIIQSSSVTSVMVVGLVNASLLSLKQALGIILGANIGTTITGWLLVLKVSEYGLLLAGISAIVYVFSKIEKNRMKALTYMGLGFIFLGLELMGEGLLPIQNMPEFISLFHLFDAAPQGVISFSGVLKASLVGMGLTALVQSSSATVGITMTLALGGLINFETAVALVVGENVGTTITAYLASLGANDQARCVAYGNILIKILGFILVLPLFSHYVKLIDFMVNPAKDIVKSIAFSHSVFNILNAIIFFPFLGIFAEVLQKLIKRKNN